MDVSVSTAELLDGVLSLRCLFPAGVLLVVWLAAVLWILKWSSASVGSCPGRLFVEGSVKSFCIIMPYQDFSGQFLLLKLAV